MDEQKKDWFAELLTEAMGRAMIRQIDLAKKAGIDPPLLNRYVHGEYLPNAGTMKKIADALDCRIALVPKDYEDAFDKGFNHGQKNMANKIIKALGGMDKYGGDKQKKRPD